MLRDQQGQVLGIGRADDLTRRDLLDGVGDLYNDALVVFEGEGGCGKSVLLWEVLLNALEPAGAERRLGAALVAVDDPRLDLARLVASWRTAAGDLPVGDDTEEVALRRLAEANPGGRPPVLLLGLDGVDEMPSDAPWQHRIERLINFFWEMHRRDGGVPLARLYVTCRSKHDIHRFVASRGTGQVLGRPPRFVVVGEFTDRELISLCGRTPQLDRDAARMLRRSLATGQAAARFAAADPYVPEVVGGAAVERVSDEAMAALRHPVMWGRFAELPPGEQLGALRGSPGSLRALATKYLGWFYWKVRLRLGREQSDAETALTAVAEHCREAAASYAPADWDAPVQRAVPDWGKAMSRKLFREASGSGLVVRVPTAGGASAARPEAWRWRHAFVLSALRGP